MWLSHQSGSRWYISKLLDSTVCVSWKVFQTSFFMSCILYHAWDSSLFSCLNEQVSVHFQVCVQMHWSLWHQHLRVGIKNVASIFSAIDESRKYEVHWVIFPGFHQCFKFCSVFRNCSRHDRKSIKPVDVMNSPLDFGDDLHLLCSFFVTVHVVWSCSFCIADKKTFKWIFSFTVTPWQQKPTTVICFAEPGWS